MQKKGALTPPPRFEAGFEAIERARDKEGGASSVSLFLLLLLLLAVLRNVRERKGKLNGAFIFRVGEYRGGGKGRFKWSFVCVCFEFRNVSPPEKSQRHALKLANPFSFPYIFFPRPR